MKYVFFILLVLLSFFAGWSAKSFFITQNVPTVQEHTEYIEQKLKTIAQFAVAEQYVSIMHNYQEKGLFNLSSFSKSAIIRAKARVKVGFDIENLEVNILHDHKIIEIKNWPEPQELSFELDADYFDLKQGLFAGFDQSELNIIKETVEQKLRQKVDYDKLSKISKNQANELIALLEAPLKLQGWKINIINIEKNKLY